MAAEPGAGAGGRLTALAARLAGLSGWRRLGVAALCGALASAALPPLYLVPLLIPAFCGLLWLLDGARGPRQAAFLGWSFGFGHMLTGLYWIGIAFLVDAGRFGVLMPFAVLGMAAGMALFPALAVLLVAWTGWRGPARVVFLAGAWLAVEWLRSWVLTGFPWNLLGTVWAFSPEMLQLASVTGVWGLSLIALLAAAAPAVLCERDRPGPGQRGWRVNRAFAVALLAVLPALVWGGGALRLSGAPAPGSDGVEGVRLRLVQPAIEQKLKWRAELRKGHVDKQIGLSLAGGQEGISHVIWAETAVPYFVSGEPVLRRVLSKAVPPGGLLLTGAPRGERGSGEPRVWNSFYALDGRGEIVATYDKHHLVPFGEYTPLRGLLGLAKLTAGSGDFSPGPGPRTLELPGLPPVSPLICYEAIFPGRVIADGPRPEWLLNVTNDAWFGTSSGPYQHFASARIRSVEEGLPLVRVANSGISAVIDSHGRIIARLGLNEVGVIDSILPRPREGATLYAKLGNLTALILALVAALFSLILHRVTA